MKKRKPPIIAVSILLICIAVTVGYNYRSGIDPNAPPDKPINATPDVKVGQARPTQSVSATANMAKSELGDAAAAAPDPATPQKRSPMFGKGPPMIENPQPSLNKPTPNDTSVSSEWYVPNSAKSHQ